MKESSMLNGIVGLTRGEGENLKIILFCILKIGKNRWTKATKICGELFNFLRLSFKSEVVYNNDSSWLTDSDTGKETNKTASHDFQGCH